MDIQELREKVKSKFLKKSRVAEDLGIASGNFSQWLNGADILSKERLDRIKEYFKI